MTATPANPVPRIGLSREEVALSIGVSPTTVDVMVAEGRLPPPRRWHTRRIWRTVEIDAFMAEWPTDGQDQQSGAPDEWRAKA